MGALVGMGIPDIRPALRRTLKNVGLLLSVHCDTSEEIDRAKDVLKLATVRTTSHRPAKERGHDGVETDLLSEVALPDKIPMLSSRPLIMRVGRAGRL